MTTLVAWFGADEKSDGRRPASLYFASDSRISWDEKPRPHWDHAKKVFASRTSPDIFGFSGGVESGLMLLSQVASLVDHGVLFAPMDDANQRYRKFFHALQRTWEFYPLKKRQDVSLLHGFRIGDGANSRFYVSSFKYRVDSRKWINQLLECPRGEDSSVLTSSGSGSETALRWIAQRNECVDVKNTARAVFSGVCDAILSEIDPATGGSPQLVALYRKANASSIGIVWNDKLFFDGQPVEQSYVPDEIEWRNRFFERIDKRTKELLLGAQSHDSLRG